MKYQMTLLALGAKCGCPSGGDQAACGSTAARVSRASMAPSASPVKPMPQSARNVRRLTRPQLQRADVKENGETARLGEDGFIASTALRKRAYRQRCILPQTA